MSNTRNLGHPLLLQNIQNISSLEMNVLQVAIDHMIEHLEDLLSDNGWKTEEEAVSGTAGVSVSLEAAKKLKRWFA
tara:strand:+ start:555 stop:782 length:228 start_codon:yes stop_codon:yes gene_type:complete